MSKHKLAAVAAPALAALLVGTGPAAAGGCARAEEITALKVAAEQQQLMVAGYMCHDAARYNRFVRSHRPELRRLDRTMMRLFQRNGGGYDTFKTHLANVAALRQIREGGFCADANREFRAASRRRQTLANLVADEPAAVELPFTSCT